LVGEDRALPPLPSAGEPAAHDGLGAALVAVDVGGVEEVDAVVVGGVHDRVGVGFVGLLTEVHGAEAEPRDLQTGTTEVGVLHVSTLPPTRPSVQPSLSPYSLALRRHPRTRGSGDRVHQEPELEPPAPPPPLKPPPQPEPPEDPELAVAANVPPAEEAKLPAPSAMLVKSGNIAPL